MNALRLVDGVPTGYYAARTGQPLTSIAAQLQLAREKGLLEPWDTRLRPTERGRLFLNDLLEMFLEA